MIKLEKWLMRVMKSRKIKDTCPVCKSGDYVANNSIKSVVYYVYMVAFLTLGVLGLYVGMMYRHYGQFLMIIGAIGLIITLYLYMHYFRRGKRRGVLVCWDCEHIWYKDKKAE